MRLARCVANKKKEYDALQKKKKPKDTHMLMLVMWMNGQCEQVSGFMLVGRRIVIW
jgi:hypothetical protein